MIDTAPPLLQTKLQRPRATDNLVARSRLIEMLERGLPGPLSLVNAAAGFGKTTLVSMWLDRLTSRERVHTPSAWLSLDEHDSDLVVFLRYFIAALRTIFPAGCADTLALLEAPQPVAQASLVVALSNDIERLPARCILVLDDYHAIRDAAVHDFLSELLHHWSQRLHLVLISRISPPLPLANLRATGQVVEIRTRDLRFTQEESAEFFAMTLAFPLSRSAVAMLDQHIEGWVAGLRLATLSLRAGANAEVGLANLSDNSAEITDYLMDQVISRQPPAILRFLLATSILDRFCAALCERVIGILPSGEDLPYDIRACIQWLERANLFVIPLDNDQEWYRYHHLFRDLLRRRLLAEVGPELVAELHRAAAAWSATQGWTEEALHHALAIGDLDLAARSMQMGLCSVLNREDRPTLERWLHLLPENFIQRHPWLLMIKALTLQFLWQLSAIWKLLGQIEALIGEGGGAAQYVGDGHNLQVLRGLVAVFRGQEAFYGGQAVSAIAYCEEALTLLPEQWRYARGGILMFWGVSMHAAGQGETVRRKLMDEYESLLKKGDAYSLRILLTVCLNSFEAGNLEHARQVAQTLLEKARQGQLAILEGWAHYILGAVHYQWNELETAAHHFETVVDKRYVVHIQAARNGMIGLVWVHLARAETRKAWQILELLSQLDIERTGEERDDTRSLRAQLDCLQGDVEKALRWTDAYTVPAPERLINWLQDPHLAKAQILLARGAASDVQAALDILESLHEIARRNFAIRFQIKILALHALALKMQRRADDALVALQMAVNLARPRGFIRVFVDLGPPMQTLLLRSAGPGDIAEAIRRILAAFPAPARRTETDKSGFGIHAANARLVEPLTNRELEVLSLLHVGLSDKEIAHRLSLSPTTVKRHTANLYGKLGVNRRWDAVIKAEALEILPRP